MDIIRGPIVVLEENTQEWRSWEPHVVLWTEPVVLVVCHMTFCPAHLPGRNQWQFL